MGYAVREYLNVTVKRTESMTEVSFQAERLDALMKERGLSNGQLAVASDVSRSMIHYMRRGERTKVSAENVAAIAGALGVSPHYLMGETEDRSPIQKTMSTVAANIVDLVDKLPPSKQRELQELGKALLQIERSLDVETIYGELMEQITRLAEIDGGKEALDRLLKHLSAASAGASGGSSVSRRRRRLKDDGESVDEPTQGDN